MLFLQSLILSFTLLLHITTASPQNGDFPDQPPVVVISGEQPSRTNNNLDFPSPTRPTYCCGKDCPAETTCDINHHHSNSNSMPLPTTLIQAILLTGSDTNTNTINDDNHQELKHKRNPTVPIPIPPHTTPPPPLILPRGASAARKRNGRIGCCVTCRNCDQWNPSQLYSALGEITSLLGGGISLAAAAVHKPEGGGGGVVGAVATAVPVVEHA